ncbi:uncharacterized protein LY79DRAFT_4778 [Colletotrichum navitas]|uniref:Uncharacterized protein n=1 Tax=Colletotrichum navitas TaxID=681940 RepID=A0AAD8QDK5_9PEZI|nr:uncharacterized protein LY79DRAFT_4778 [Colletotrichum navitas]KAK1600041.1 hypothetical protein LY79DRAFT_4778 [Colletotrichum navitas]
MSSETWCQRPCQLLFSFLSMALYIAVRTSRRSSRISCSRITMRTPLPMPAQPPLLCISSFHPVRVWSIDSSVYNTTGTSPSRPREGVSSSDRRLPYRRCDCYSARGVSRRGLLSSGSWMLFRLFLSTRNLCNGKVKVSNDPSPAAPDATPSKPPPVLSYHAWTWPWSLSLPPFSSTKTRVEILPPD